MGEDLKDLQQDYQSLKGVYRQLSEKRASVRRLEQQCMAKVSELDKKVHSLQEHSRDDPVKEAIQEVKELLLEISSALPKPSASYLLRLIIGDISVTLPSREDRVMYRHNYESFKMFHIVLMCILSIVSLVLSDSMVPSALVHCVSVWYYFTVTLRELILISNGSRIKVWWLVHHYCSIVVAILLLVWPPGDCYHTFKNQFMLFSFWLSFVMGVQFRYQRAKLYRQVAMGEKHHMAISQEGKLSRDIKILVACLVSIYAFQLYNAYTLMKLYFSTDIDCSDWQVPVLSILFFILAAMNSSTLSSVIYKKSKKKSF